MDPRLIDLYVQRGRLRERIGAQRAQVARDLAPLGAALHTVDRGRALLHQSRLWLVAHPALVTTAVVTLLVWRPRTVVRAARGGYFLWRNASRLSEWVSIGLRAR
jgi:hypothetical protein